ncbi:MAG: hypothetical protein KDA87_00915 [Planctomycetales bacterium]|nr:hypothetical protein [Planctomycetales bacterium]
MMRQCVLVLILVLFSQVSAWAGLQIQFDYQYDSFGFFDEPERREALEMAARVVNRYVDNFAAIEPDADNTWATFFNRPDGMGSFILNNEPVPEDTIIVYAAGMNITGRLAQAIDAPGLPTGTAEFEDAVNYRGQVGAGSTPATDYGVWGGTISFNNNPDEVPWYYGRNLTGIEPDEFDFITVASHELMHLLGMGIAKSWRDQVDGNRRFQGEHAVDVGSATNPGLTLDSAESHWARGTKSWWNGIRQEALLAPAIAPGQRQMPTLLDRAAMLDIGWEEALPGDANLDRVFDSSDLVQVFAAGVYETNDLAGWQDGDWNDDGVFDSSDLVAALQIGEYADAAAVTAVRAVPEPCGTVPFVLLIVLLVRRQRIRPFAVIAQRPSSA